MKKLLLTITAAAAIGASASAEFGMTYQWGQFLVGTPAAQSKFNAIANAPEGDYFVGGTVAKTTSVAWGDVDVTPASPITTAFQRDFTVGRVAPDGTLKWFVTSPDANMSANSMLMASTPDGGVVVAGNFTFNKDGGGAPTLFTLTDKGGNNVSVTLPDTPAGKSPYADVVIKFSAAGVCEWTTTVASESYDVAGKFDANAVGLTGLAVDKSGNVYIGGQYRNVLVFADGSKSPAAANINVASAGKTTSEGDAFIAKFTPDGKYSSVLTSGTATPYAAKESLQAICIGADGTTLYATALVSGIAGSDAYTFFGKPASVNDLNGNVVYAAIDTETMTCTAANALQAGTTAATSTHSAMIKNIEMVAGKLYINGSNNGALLVNGVPVAETTINKLINVAICIDPATMEVENVFTNPAAANISNSYSVYADSESGLTYVLGYIFTGELSLVSYNADASVNTAYVLGMGVSDMSPALFNNDTKQILVPGSTKGFTDLPGGATTPTFTGFTGSLLAFTLPNLSTTGVTAPAALDAAPAPVEYFNLQGIRIANPASGTLVIRRQGATATKEIVK